MSVYYGTENLVDTLKEGLNPTLTGISKDQQFGSGFYFYMTPNLAEEQIGQQGLRVEHPAVMSGNVTLENPLKLKFHQTIQDAEVTVSPEQIHQILTHSERMFDEFSPLLDWKDEEHHRISEELIQEVCQHYAQPENFWDLEKDLFGDFGEAKTFRKAVNEVLGYDGVVIDLGLGRENKVAWFKEQVSDFEIHKILPKPEVQPEQRAPQVPVVPKLEQRINRTH